MCRAVALVLVALGLLALGLGLVGSAEHARAALRAVVSAGPSSAPRAWPPGTVLSQGECRALRRTLPGGHTAGASQGAGPPAALQHRSNASVCWSALEWPCFSSLSSAFPPSRALSQALEQYQVRWRNCSARETPQQVLAALAGGRPTLCRYILWSPMEMGLGNLMLNLVSTFVYALLTSRIMLVEPDAAGQPALMNLLCEPFPRTPSWLLAHREALGGTYEQSEYGYSFPTNPAFNVFGATPHLLPFHFHHRVDMEPFYCAAFHRWARNASALVTSGNMFWVPVLYLVPEFQRSLEQLFPTRRVFSTLAQQLLHPNNRVWGNLTHFLHSLGPPWAEGGSSTGPLAASAARTAKTRRLLLSQKRSGARVVRISVHYRHKFGPNVEGALYKTAAWLETFDMSLISAKAASKKKARLQFDVMVASMQPEFREGFAAAMAARNVSIRKLTMLTTDDNQDSNQLEHNERALFEILALALYAEASIMTPRSTFGYAFQALSTGKPFFFAYPSKDERSEPCLLFRPDSIPCSRFQRPTSLDDLIKQWPQPLNLSADTSFLEECPDAAFYRIKGIHGLHVKMPKK